MYLRPIQKGGRHLRGLIGVIVDGLLAQEDQVHLLLLGQFGQDFAHVNGLQGLGLSGAHLHMHTAISAHGQGGSNRLLETYRHTTILVPHGIIDFKYINIDARINSINSRRVVYYGFNFQ